MNKKRIPKSLKDCYGEDAVSAGLWNWAEWLKLWGYRLLIVLCVIGIAAAVSNGVEAGYTAEDNAAIAVISAIVSTLILWGLYAALEYLAYQTVALLVAALASLVQHTRISADVALYRAAEAEGFVEDEEDVEEADATEEDEDEEPVPSVWVCKACGSTNPQGVLNCRACGAYK